ncbi:MAG: alpha/beta hydrolase [Anaerolineales bacterium]|nr:alpha/beta hydrolase [Anaerolineales bacterium]
MTSPQFDAIRRFLAANPTPPGIPLADIRAAAEMLAAQTPLLPGIYVEELTIPAPAGHAIPALLLAPEAGRDARVMLYLHGGGYVQGSPLTHRDLASRLALGCGLRVLLIDYRLAPEHPFPAAVQDAAAAYRWLLAGGIAPRSLVVAGDSAGGGLSLALLLALRDANEPLPACGVLLSPWTDLALTGASLHANGPADVSLTLPQLTEYAAWYLGEAAATTPLASPLYAELGGLPPLFLQVGTAEILLDDARRLETAVRAAGGDITCDEWPEMFHGWQGFAGLMPEAVEALARVGAFVHGQL